jgi:uncharacterized protein DUF2800
MAQHSSIVGGSTAGRLINCPASLTETRKLPPTAEAPSEYADEGTSMHDVMQHLMRAREAGGDPDLIVDDLIGDHFYDRTLTREHVDTMIIPALDALDQLEMEWRNTPTQPYAAPDGGPFRVLAVEAKVTFPGIPGAFGTCDLVLGNRDTIMLVDWKFGQGIGISAVYTEAAGELVNPQLLYYAAAAIHTKKRMFSKRRIVIAIVQPRSVTPLTSTEISRKEVKMFVEDLHNAVLAAVDRAPPYRRGEHCRFAPCKATCPLWTGPLLDLSALKPVARQIPQRRDVTAYGAYLAHAKGLLDAIVSMKTEVDAQMHAYLEAGGAVPGWKLKDKPTRRAWVDADKVAYELSALGFTDAEIWREPELVTFASADATAKRRGVKIPEELRIAPPSTGTTLATADDPAPPVERALLVEKFTASLAALKQEQPAK